MHLTFQKRHLIFKGGLVRTAKEVAQYLQLKQIWSLPLAHYKKVAEQMSLTKIVKSKK